jgi:dephospho-CoA kinase
MLKVGLTGGIGSGKTTVARLFALLGVPVYNADDAAKRLMQEDAGLRASIIAAFSGEAYPDGKLDRAFLAKQVFNDPVRLAQLNALVHPATISDATRWMQEQTAPYTLKEAALLFESGSDKGLDLVIGVDAPEDIRIRRVMAREQTTEEEVRKRLDKQMPEHEKLHRCNFILHNDERQMLIPQVIALHEKLTALAAAPHQNA